MQEAKMRKDRIDALKEELKQMVIYERDINNAYEEQKKINEKTFRDWQQVKDKIEEYNDILDNEDEKEID